MPKRSSNRFLPTSLASLVLAFSVVAYSASIGTVGNVPSPQPVPQPQPATHSSVTSAPSHTANQQPRPQVAKPPAPLPAGHPNYVYYAQISPSGPLYAAGTEPFLSRISAQNGWAAVGSDTQAPVIAVIDTGFQLDHQDLAGRLVPGWDFYHNDSDPSAGTDDPNGEAVFHGTMTAGLAALLNPGAKIMPLQALSDEGDGTTDTVAAAVQYAADNGANVISLSLGSSSDDTFLQSKIDYAIGKGILVVAAAGNGGCNCMLYPANYPEVLAVGATDSHNNRASFSSYGANLDVMAPGTAGDVCSATYSPTSTNSYTCAYSGTSFATPIVAGLASLLLNQDPAASVDDLTRFVDTSASVVSGMAGQSLPTTQYGYGEANVLSSVLSASLGGPRGQLLNKRTLSLSTSDPVAGPTMDSTCAGISGATCDLLLTGPGGVTIDLGSIILDATGAADVTWNAQMLGLTPGTWQITATLTAYNESAVAGPFSFTVTP